MEALENLKSRVSIRKYKAKQVPEEILEELIDCARLAPTARNEQPWEFIIIREKSIIEQIGSLAPNGSFMKDAPVSIAVFCKDTKYYLEDGSAATENILLAAHAHGIGGCWIAGDKKPYCEAVKKLLNVPEGYKLVSMLSLGYPTKEPTPHKKRNLQEVLHWENF